MRENRRLVTLILIMIAVVIAVEVSTLAILFQTTLTRERARLVATARAQVALVEALADRAPDVAALIESQRQLREAALGETGAIDVARRHGGDIIWLSPARPVRQPSESLDRPPGEPMQAALDGGSGTMAGRDQSGRWVLAAYQPVPGTELGVVAKIDIGEIARRYLRAAALATAASLVVAAGATWLTLKVSGPIIRRMRDNETRYRQLFDNMGVGVAVYAAVDGGADFVFRDFNRGAEASERLERRDVIGRRLTEIYPGIREFGLVDVLARVWRSGEPEALPARLYRDATREEWRENWIYRLPSGEVVALFDDVSERKLAEEHSREREARFRGTFENAAVGIAHLGLDGSWQLLNQQFCVILGYQRQELERRRFDEITHPQDRDVAVEKFQELIRGESDAYTLEKRCFHKDGRIVWINVTNALQRGDDGEPLYVISVMRDVSLRKQAQDALGESELRMRALLDASRDEILLVSGEGQILAINKAARDRLARRCAGADPLRATLATVLPPEEAAQRLAAVRCVVETGNMVHYDLQIRSRWFDLWFYPVRRPEGDIQEVAVYAREVTDRRRSEADLRTLWQAIEQSPSSVVITSPNGTIEYVNPKFCEATGYAREEAIGLNPRVLKSGRTDVEDYSKLWKTITSGHVWRGEFLNRKKNGQLFWEMAAIAPVKDTTGRVTHYVGVKEDISERKEMEEQLRQSQKMQALGQLTGGIAHDFNNLLAIIIGNLELLDESLNGDNAPRELIEDALWSAHRGAELTHRLLAFARRQPLKPDVIDFNGIIRGLSDLLRRTLGGGIRVREDLAADLWSAYADRGELERALLNLAVNARDAMPRGGMLTLETRNATIDAAYAEQYDEFAAGDYVVLSVCDSGAGMAPDVVRHAFEPFFTTKEVGKGSGLGLSMVYGFVKQSGGHIEIDSHLARGTRVSLFLPRARDGRQPRQSSDVSADVGQFRDRSVLLVEDEPKLRRVAVKMLGRLGLTIFQAESGEDALALLQQRHVDLLFTDIELPGGMSGAELADRAQELLPGIKILFTTGYARDAVLADPGKKEMPWLLKPYSQGALTRQLTALLAPDARTDRSQGADSAGRA